MGGSGGSSGQETTAAAGARAKSPQRLRVSHEVAPGPHKYLPYSRASLAMSRPGLAIGWLSRAKTHRKRADQTKMVRSRRCATPTLELADNSVAVGARDVVPSLRRNGRWTRRCCRQAGTSGRGATQLARTGGAGRRETHPDIQRRVAGACDIEVQVYPFRVARVANIVPKSLVSAGSRADAH
jgi:hypothetical protein